MMKIYKEKLNNAIKAQLGITYRDCMTDDLLSILFLEDCPIDEVIEWIANKYDLIILNRRA